VAGGRQHVTDHDGSFSKARGYFSEVARCRGSVVLHKLVIQIGQGEMVRICAVRTGETREADYTDLTGSGFVVWFTMENEIAVRNFSSQISD
jgi:hypothetical protein